MSLVIVPGQFQATPKPVGKFASTMLSVKVAEIAEPSRFRKGREYLRDDAVTRLEIDTGRMRAVVVGGQPQPYLVDVLVRVLPRLEPPNDSTLRLHLHRLTPDMGDMTIRCTCPDPEVPCKHVVAALLALSGELIAQPNLLVQWRCEPPADDARVEVGSRARGHLRLAPVIDTPDEAPPAPVPPVPPSAVPERTTARRSEPAPEPDEPTTEPAAESPTKPVDPWVSDEWQHFLGSLPLPAAPEVPRERLPAGRSMIGVIDVGRVIADALSVLTGD